MVLKPGLGERNSLHKALLVGAHRFSGESFNNCCIDGLLRGWPTLTPAFGFTEEETTEVLRAAGLSERLEDVRRWYGGYRSGKRDLYRPADVMRLASEVQAGKVAADSALPNYAAHDVLPSAVIRKIPMLGWMDRDAVIALARTTGRRGCIWMIRSTATTWRRNTVPICGRCWCRRGCCRSQRKGRGACGGMTTRFGFRTFPRKPCWIKRW